LAAYTALLDNDKQLREVIEHAEASGRILVRSMPTMVFDL